MKNNEIYICSEKSALNMAYQGLTRTPRKVEKVCEFLGLSIIGLSLKPPLSAYSVVYVLPMFDISMENGKYFFFPTIDLSN